MNAPLNPVRLRLEALYDPQQQRVGLEADATDDFGHPAHLRESVEILAALAARANFLASEIIKTWGEEEPRKRALYEHFAALKEGLLDQMIQDAESGS